MALEPATYLRDTDDENDTKGIVILEAEDENYRVTENRAGNWCKPFWMPRAELRGHETELVGPLPDEKFRAVAESAQ